MLDSIAFYCAKKNTNFVNFATLQFENKKTNMDVMFTFEQMIRIGEQGRCQYASVVLPQPLDSAVSMFEFELFFEIIFEIANGFSPCTFFANQK